ncbi:MFS transporter [Rhizobium sp. C4]|uniref:MFS transporter n=1 Tax=Rhizobium sp. C4 TaxID=1349800 RepID=UPI001E4835CE|nr:MFS transporter [Rhizobium sp. C4]MCD2172025.1 MFS transporter [Rhizobium sp. C4]
MSHSSSPASLSKLRLIAVLAVSQLVGWGTTFDMPSVLGRAMERDLGLPFETIFGGLTAMMIVMALASPRAGRLLVRLGASRVMAMGSVLMAAGLTVLSLSQGLVSYFAAWLIIGLGGTCALSVSANTAVVERQGAAAKRTIGTLMIFTGLSSALFWPILSHAESAIGWRASLQIAAAAHLILLVPLHCFALPARGDVLALSASAREGAKPLPRLDARGRLHAFLLIASTSSLNSLTSFGISASLIELLKLAGAAPALALTLASLRGVIGISARLADLIAGERTSPVVSGLAASLAMFGAFLMLAAFPASSFVVPLLFVLLYGAGSGVAAVARALLPLSFFTREDFATMSSNVALPQNIASALSPVIFAAMMENFGLKGVIALALTLTFLTCLSMAGLGLLKARAEASGPALS